MSRPSQAVILCGGLGTRLRPITDTLPKPLAPIHGRPFLAFLIEQLREQGIERIVLLTGYRGEMIRERFGDGSACGVRIDYSEGPAEWETGRRIWEARTMLDPQFVLLYSDNFATINLDTIAARHDTHGGVVTFLVQAKKPGNIRLSADGRVDTYDPTRTAPGLDRVEIGYMIVERDRLMAAFVEPDVSFSRMLEGLARQGQVAGLLSGDPYHSISDIDRWQLAERYLAIKRILLIDRDGTINQRPPKGGYVTSWEQFRWIDETVEAMRQLAAQGFRFVVISNQAGIGRGVVDPAVVDGINRRMVTDLAVQGIEVLDVYVCPHHWDDHCACRKPAPGMFFDASRAHLLRMDRTIYVGDDPRDSRAAFNAGCLSVLVGPERDQDPGGGVRPAFTAPTVLDAAPWIVSRFEAWEEWSAC
jgi:histidinol-phosphate phosphatase family protein